MEIIITGNRKEGKTTLAVALYHFCKMLGYKVKINSYTKMSSKDLMEQPFPEIKQNDKTIIIKDKCSDEY